MQRASISTPLLASGLTALLCACSDGGGSAGKRTVIQELEPNGSAQQARSLRAGRPGHGSLASIGDVDYWAAKLKQGSLVKLEVFGTRLDQATWDNRDNLPRLRVLDRDGTSVLLEHDFSGQVATAGAWGYGKHDLDVPLWRVPADGTYYISLENDDPALAGGDYAVSVRAVPNELDQAAEVEAAKTSGGNDTFATAEKLKPSLLRGWHVDGEADWYEVDIPQTSIAQFEVVAYRNGVVEGDDAYFDPRLSLFESDGATLVQADSDSLFADPQLATELAAGTYFLRVDEDGGAGDGTYYLRYKRESLQGSVGESESNDDAASADSIGLGQRVKGELASGADVDYYRFAGKAGQQIALQFWDVTNSNVAVAEIGASLLGSDGLTPLEVDGTGGQQVRSTMLLADGDYYVRVDGAATPYRLRVALLRQSGLESEVNNLTSEADPFGSSKRMAGVIDGPGDLDVFSFPSKKDRLVTVQVYASASVAQSGGVPALGGFGSSLQPLISIRDIDGETLAVTSTLNSFNVGTEGVSEAIPVAAVSFIAPAKGMYYAKIQAENGGSGPDHSYLIELR